MHARPTTTITIWTYTYTCSITIKQIITKMRIKAG